MRSKAPHTASGTARAAGPTRRHLPGSTGSTGSTGSRCGNFQVASWEENRAVSRTKARLLRVGCGMRRGSSARLEVASWDKSSGSSKTQPQPRLRQLAVGVRGEGGSGGGGSGGASRGVRRARGAGPASMSHSVYTTLLTWPLRSRSERRTPWIMAGAHPPIARRSGSFVTRAQGQAAIARGTSTALLACSTPVHPCTLAAPPSMARPLTSSTYASSRQGDGMTTSGVKDKTTAVTAGS